VPAPKFTAVSLIRVVATEAALDHLCADELTGLWNARLAPDEALFSNRSTEKTEQAVVVIDPHGIAASDHGWSATTMSGERYETDVAPALEWHWEDRSRPGLGLLHAVPIVLVKQPNTADVIMLCPRTVTHELEERLS
jgi:hypothetical protein